MEMTVEVKWISDPKCNKVRRKKNKNKNMKNHMKQKKKKQHIKEELAIKTVIVVIKRSFIYE